MTLPFPRPGEYADPDPRLVGRLLEVIETEILPLTRAGVAAMPAATPTGPPMAWWT